MITTISWPDSFQTNSFDRGKKAQQAFTPEVIMKTKSTVSPKNTTAERALGTRKKPKSLRPMRSMMAVRSLKPKTIVASMKPEAELQ